MSDTPRTQMVCIRCGGFSSTRICHPCSTRPDAITHAYVEMLEREIAALKAQLAESRDDEARECADIAANEICGCCWNEDQQAAAEEIAAAIERRIQGRASLKRVQP